jgi:hypothetical protein
MRYCLLFSLLLFSASLNAMQPSIEQQLALQRTKKLLLADFEEKRTFFSGSPIAHRALKADFTHLQTLADHRGYRNNYNLLKKIIDEGFLKPHHEVQVICNSIRQDPRSTPQQKQDMQTVFDTICNTSTFFTLDQEEFERDPQNGLSSETLFQNLCKDPEFLDASHRLKTDSTARMAFLKKIRTFSHAVLEKNGILPIPEPYETKNNRSYLKFLELNEYNPKLCNPENYPRLRALFIGTNILDYYFATFSMSQPDIEKKLNDLVSLQDDKANLEILKN